MIKQQDLLHVSSQSMKKMKLPGGQRSVWSVPTAKQAGQALVCMDILITYFLGKSYIILLSQIE